MTLLLFCLAMLSTSFILIFGMWWDGNESFNIHLTALVIAVITLISALLLFTIYPIIKPRFVSNSQKNNLDNIARGNDISKGLSTPAAVLDGYIVIFANNVFLSELGLSGMRELVIDLPLTNLVHPADHVNLARAIAAVSDDHQNSETVTLRMLYMDGTTFPVHMSLSPLNEDGKSNLNLLQFSSVSAEKSVITSPSEQFDYHQIIDRIEQIVFQINVAQELIFLNPSWERILDHTKEESLNKSFLSFIHPEDIPLVEAHLALLIQGKRSHCDLQIRIIAKNGTSCWVELRAATTSLLRGERTSVIGTLTDINAMKQAELSSKSNRPSPLDMILADLPALIYRCKNDRNWTFEYASDGCLEVTGYQPHEIVNSPTFSFLQIIHPDDQTYVWQHIQEQLLKEQDYQLIFRIITRSGTIKWVLERGAGVFSSTGELLSLEGFVTELAGEGDKANKLLRLVRKQLLFTK